MFIRSKKFVMPSPRHDMTHKDFLISQGVVQLIII